MSRMIIILFNGTPNKDASKSTEAEKSFSNVYALNQLIAEVGRAKHQVTFYLPGIGTKPLGGGRSIESGRSSQEQTKFRQQIFGDNIEQIILRAYVNLCANFRLGDDIALIGFSRGAIAARVTQPVSDFGILQQKNLLHT